MLMPLLRRLGGPVGRVIDRSPWLSRLASRAAVNAIVASTRNRPHPLSTFGDYVSWQGLTDRTYLARHLPPRAAPEAPTVQDVAALFRRPAGGGVASTKSTCLFPAFAQYLTDGFLRTDMDRRDRNTSNHEIDLCPLYGRTEAQTRALRLGGEVEGERGLLRSQTINGEEWSPWLFRKGSRELAEPAFEKLDPPLGLDKIEDQALVDVLFAVGGDRVNTSPHVVMMNTLFLREHNRVARRLSADNPGWDDERVFQTARNVVIAIFIKLVVEDYINHIAPLPFKLRAEPSVAWKARWNRTNWMTVEFSLLYRWHPLLPDAVDWPGPEGKRSIPLHAFLRRNDLLPEAGLMAAFAATAGQPANAVGPFNTAEALFPFEERAIEQARGNRLNGYNAYRRAFGMKERYHIHEISSDPKVVALLKSLYRNVEDVEFYPGIFAEDRVPDSPLPELLMRMVAVDAFSQALTNPLLSEHVWNPATFSDWGWAEIAATATLADVVRRNVPAPSDAPVAMTLPDWRPGGKG